MINHRKSILFFIGVLVLIFLGYHLTSNLKNFIELDLYDEADYLISSKHIMDGGSRIIYPLFYKFLRLFESNDISLYYLNQRVIIILLPVCLYLLLYTYFRNITLSLFFSILFLYSNTNVSTEYIIKDFIFTWAMKINNYTLIIICLSACVIYFLKKKKYSTISLFTIAFLVLSYCRNEYNLLFIGSIFFYTIYYLIKLRKEKKETVLFFLVIIIAVISVKVFGLPLSATEHSYLAYSQCYTRNYLQLKEMPIFPNIDLYKNSIEIFGNAKSIPEFFLSNPSEFIKNTFYNIYNTIFINSYRISDILLPQLFIEYKDKGIFSYLFSWMVIITLAIYFIRHKLILRKKNPVLLFLIICTIPTLMVFIIYIFEARYFIFFVPLIYICIIHLLMKFKYKKTVEYLLLVITVCIVLFHPSTDNYFKKNKSFVDRRVMNTLTIINKYKLDKKNKHLKILSNDGDFSKFIPNSTCLNISINDMRTKNQNEAAINLSDYDIFIITENSDNSSQNESYNTIIQYTANNKELNHILDDENQLNLYLKK